MPTENEQQHFAFISYSSKDMRFAEELESYLKHYRVPRALRKKKPWLPQKFHGIFRDKKMLLPGQDYKQTLLEAVDRCKFYIVICSKNSAVPNEEGNHYVNDGVEHFLKHPDNRKRIVPIVLREPVEVSTGSLKPYMPPAMHNDEKRAANIHAADVGAQGKERAFSDVAAALLELDNAEELWNDLEREQAAKRRNRRFALGAAALAASAGAYMAWDYYYPHTSYYADYVECNNIPVGIHELSAEQISTRHSHYRFTTQNRQVIRVSHCNSAGTPIVHNQAWETERPVTMVIEYDAQGKVSKRTHEDEHGVPKMVWRFHESGNYVNFETLAGRGLVSAFFDISSEDVFERQRKINEVVRFQLERDANGRITKEIFKNPYDNPCVDKKGVGGRVYSYNAQGQVERVKYLDSKGKYTRNSEGVGGYVLEYNDFGKVVRMKNIGYKDTNATLNSEKWASVELQLDAFCNKRVETYYGADGTLCMNKNGYAKIFYEYDDYGNIIKITYFDLDGNPCLSEDGVAKREMRCNEQGNVIEESFYDVNGSFCLYRNGYAKIINTYDKYGHLTGESFYGIDGKPCYLGLHGHMKVTYAYDERGNKTMIAYCDSKGYPCTKSRQDAGVSYGDISKEIYTYNENNKLVEVVFLGADGKPSKDCRYAKVTYDYDERDNLSEEAFFDKDGKPCPRSGVIGDSMNCSRVPVYVGGYAKVTYIYDEFGNIEQISYFDADNKPFVDPVYGYAKVAFKYDRLGKLEETAYFDAYDKPCVSSGKYAKVTYVYDDCDNLSEEAFFDKDGMPCLWPLLGYAKATYKYNENGKRTEESFFDSQGHPCLNNDGAARISNAYDERGNKTEECFFDCDGTPCRSKSGYARCLNTFDQADRKISAHYFTSSEEGVFNLEVAQYLVHYDAQGRVIEQSYYDTSGKPCLCNERNAKMTQQYDAQGNVTEVAYYGVDGTPCMTTHGYARAEVDYNEAGKQTAKRFYDAEGWLLWSVTP